MKRKSRTAPLVSPAESPLRRLPLVDLLVDTKTELLELALRSGLKVFTARLEEDRIAICGPRYAHERERPASRAGPTRSEVVLGGRKVTIQRPRVRTAAGEVPLPTFQTMAATDPLDRRVGEQMLVGVATRQYARSLEPLGPEMTSRGTSKSAGSRRFVARTTAPLAAWQSALLDGVALVGLLIDGVHLGDHCLIVALGIAADGQKHALGLWDGSTENATVCQGLLANLQSRGRRTDRSVLVILDGSKAVRKAVRATFGDAALVQRCHVHTMRTILEYLNDRQRPWAEAILRRAYQSADVKTAQRAEHALLAVVQEAYVHGVSTRKVDELMKALGLDGVSKSEVSRICGELDPLVEAFRTRALTTDYPYIWVDATYHKVRVNGRVTRQATVVAVGVTSDGERQVLGIDVGPSEDRAFWTAFLRSLVKRGLRGVRLVTSDAHEGLKQAIATVLSGATWQRCRVHFMRNLLATVPKGAREAIAAVVRTIFAQPDHATAMTQLRKGAEGLRARFVQAAALLEDAAEDILAYRHLPIEHQRQLHSTNPRERLNKEIQRRSNVVGIFPTPQSVIRLVGALLLEQDDEWAVAERRYFSAESMKQLTAPPLPATAQEIVAAIV